MTNPRKRGTLIRKNGQEDLGKFGVNARKASIQSELGKSTAREVRAKVEESIGVAIPIFKKLSVSERTEALHQLSGSTYLADMVAERPLSQERTERVLKIIDFARNNVRRLEKKSKHPPLEDFK